MLRPDIRGEHDLVDAAFIYLTGKFWPTTDEGTDSK